MKIDEELITKKLKKLVQSNSVHFYLQGTKMENVQCKSIALVSLTFIEEIDGTTRYEVSGRGSFCESFNNWSIENNKNFRTSILVQGDDIINDSEITVYLYNLYN